MDSHCFKLHRAYLISSTLSNVGEIFWVKSERTLSKVWRNIHFCVVFTDSINRTREIRRFHVAVAQQRLRVMHVQSCSLANLNLLLFCCSPSPLQKLPIVVIHKFRYHGNMSSHLSSLLRAVEKLACSKRSDTGERCGVKKAMKSGGGLRTAPHYLNACNRLWKS